MPQTPIIGSYKRPQNAEKAQEEKDVEIVDKRPKVESPAKNLSEGIQQDLQDSIDVTKSNTEKAKTYEELLAENDIPLQKAHTIVDALLERGVYEETVAVTQRITATFRTRTHGDYVRYLRALELYNPKYVEEQQELQLRYFLAASLLTYKGKSVVDKKYENPEEDFDARLKWVETQADSLIRLLATKLHKFDTVITVVMSEGVVENF